MIISFNWTTPALLVGAKTMTRRDWTLSHAMKFQPGMVVDAWDQLPRVRGARKVATIRLTAAPYQQISDALHELDYRDEGFTWLVDHGWERTVEGVLRSWRERPRMVWVVKFELVSVEPGRDVNDERQITHYVGDDCPGGHRGTFLDERSVDAPAAPDVRPAEGVDPDSDPSASPREVATTRGALGQ